MPIHDEGDYNPGLTIGSGYLDDLIDVTTSGVFNNAILKYHAGSGLWYPGSGTDATDSLDSLSDVNVAAVSSGQLLGYQGAVLGWIPVNETGGGIGSTSLTGLTDVSVTLPVANRALIYNGSAWVQGYPSGSIVLLSGVDASNPVTNRALVYNGTTWIPGFASGSFNLMSGLVLGNLAAKQFMIYDGTNFINRSGGLADLSGVNVGTVSSGQLLGYLGPILGWTGVDAGTGAIDSLNDLTDVSTTGTLEAGMVLLYNGAYWRQSYFSTQELSNVSGHGLVDRDHSLVYFPSVNKYISTHVLAAPSGLRTTDSDAQMSGNTDILQAELDKSSNLVYIPSGVYRIKPLYMRGNNSKLVGQGTLLVQTGYTDDAILTISGSHCAVEGIRIDGNRNTWDAASAGRSEGIRLVGNYNTLRGISVVNLPTGLSANGIMVTSNNNLITNCYVSGGGFANYYCSGDNNTFRDNISLDAYKQGFRFSGSINGTPYHKLTVDGFYSNQMATGGLYLMNDLGDAFMVDPGTGSTQVINFISLNNLYIGNGPNITAGGNCAKIAKCRNVNITNSVFRHSPLTNSLRIVEGIDNLNIENCWLVRELNFDSTIGNVNIKNTRFGEAYDLNTPPAYTGTATVSIHNPQANIFNLQPTGHVSIEDSIFFGFSIGGINFEGVPIDSGGEPGYKLFEIKNCKFIGSGNTAIGFIQLTTQGKIDVSRRFNFVNNSISNIGGGTVNKLVYTSTANTNYDVLFNPLNQSLSQYSGTDFPTGTLIQWNIGDQILKSNASSGDMMGWACIQGGRPGTWAAFGTVGNVGIPQYAFDITRFGAVGTNTGINNTGAIAATINAAIASGGPQTIFFPPGIYMVQDPTTGNNAGLNGGLINIPTGASDITLYGPDATVLVGPNGGSEATFRCFGSKCKIIGLTRNLNANYAGDPTYRKTKDNTGFEINGTLGGGIDCSIIDCKTINGYGDDDALTQGTTDFITINSTRATIRNCQSFDCGWNAFRIDGDQQTVQGCVASGFRGNGIRINDGDIAFISNNILTSTRNHGRAGILSDAGSSSSFDASGLPLRRTHLYLDNNYVYINPNGLGLGTDLLAEGAGVGLKLGSTMSTYVKGGYYGAGAATNNSAIRLEDVLEDVTLEGVRIDPQVFCTTTDNTTSSIYHGFIRSISGSISGYCQFHLSGTTNLQVSKSLYVHGSKVGYFNREHIAQSLSGGSNIVILTDVLFPFTNSTGALTIGLGSKNFTVSSGQPFTVGARLRAANTGDHQQYMEGFITSHNVTDTVTIEVDTIGGTGNYPVWAFSSVDPGTFARSSIDKLKIRNCIFGGPTFSTSNDNNEGPLIDSVCCRILDIENCKFYQGGSNDNSYNAISWNCNTDAGFELIRIVNNDLVFNTNKISSHVGRMINPITSLSTTTLVTAGKTIAYNNRLTNIGAGGTVLANSATANYNRQILFSTDGENPHRFRWTTPPNASDSNTIFSPGDVIVQTVEGQPGNYEWLCTASGGASNFVLRDAPYKYIAIASGNTYTSGTAESGITPTGSAGIGSLQFGANRALTVGEAFTTKAGGVFSCTGSPVPTLTIRSKLGNVGDTGEKDLATINISSTGSNLRWRYDLRAVVKSVGAAGTLKVMGTTAYETSTNVWVESGIIVDLGSVNTSNTSHQRRVSVSAQYSIAETGNIATCSQFEVMPW